MSREEVEKLLAVRRLVEERIEGLSMHAWQMPAQRTKNMKKTISDTKTNIGSTSEKCPKMSPFVLKNGV